MFLSVHLSQDKTANQIQYPIHLKKNVSGKPTKLDTRSGEKTIAQKTEPS